MRVDKMTSTDVSAIVGCGSGQLSRLELLQQQQQQENFRLASPSSMLGEHECNCMHHHYHGSNVSSSSATAVSNAAYPNHHEHFNRLNQHMHSNGFHHHQKQQQQSSNQDGNFVYNNGSTNSECNQLMSATNDASQSGCSNAIHYVHTSRLNAASPNMNIPNGSCECAHVQHHHHHHHHHQRQSSEQSGRSSQIVSCDENPSSAEEGGSGMSSSGMITGCKSSKRHMNNLDSNQQRLRSAKCAEVADNEAKGNQDDIKYSNAMERMDIYSDSNEDAIKIGDDTNEDERPPRLPPRPPPRLRNTVSNEAVPHPQAGVRKYVIWCLICGGVLCLLGVMFLAVYFLLRSYTSTVGYFETVPPFVPATLLLLTGLCIMSLARRRNRYSYLIKLSGACSLASALTCALVTVTTTVIHMSRLQALKECQYTQKTRTCTCSSTLSESEDAEESGGSVRFVFDATTDCGVVHGALYSCLRAVFGLSVAGVFVAVFSCMLVYQLLSHERKKMYWEQLELRCRSLYSGPPIPAGPAIIGNARGAPCRCCEQCHAHRAAISTAYTWDGDGGRFWAGQAGNFYSPNPGDENTTTGSNQRNRSWNWPRMPWQRNIDPATMAAPNAPAPMPTPAQRFHQNISSSDSQYGFSNGPAAESSAGSQQNGYTVIAPYGVWGPPPPYSDPNSPARRGRYQYIHPSVCHQGLMEQHIPANQPIIDCHQQQQHNPATMESRSGPFCPQQQQQQQQQRNVIKRQVQVTGKESAPSDSDGGADVGDQRANAARKTKKLVDVVVAPSPRQNVFNDLLAESSNHSEVSENEYNEPQHPDAKPAPVDTPAACTNRCRPKLGIENIGFQSIDAIESGELNGESEVYFADVSSCCNTSVKNDNYYDDASQRRVLESEKTDVDEYLSQRFGNREPSTRSRLPFPQDSGGPPPPAPRTSIMQKEVSHQSICSIDSSEKTDFTDLSPTTPTAGGFQPYLSNNSFNAGGDFIATFPYNEQSQEAHRRSTKNLHQDISLVSTTSDAQYETIKELSQSPAMRAPHSYLHGAAGTPTKPSNATPIKSRHNLGTNISAIIQNLSGNDIGLLYPENMNSSVASAYQKQDCNDVINSNNIVVSAEKQREWPEINGNKRI